MDLLPRRARAGAVVTGNPVRPEVLAGDGDKAVSALGLHGCRPAAADGVHHRGRPGFGADQRACQFLPWLVERANVVHQCGALNVEAMADAAAGLDLEVEPRYRAFGYIGAELPDVGALAEPVMVSRAGAGQSRRSPPLGRPQC